MEQAQRAQLMYLNQDIKLLGILSNKIANHFKRLEVERDSPNLYVTNLGYKMSPKAQVYVSALESIINQLHMIISNIVSSETSLAIGSKNVACPKFIPFGKAMGTLWDYMRELTNNRGQKNKVCVVNEDKSVTNLYEHKETQTFQRTIDRCDSCFIAEASIKKIKYAIESELYSSSDTESTEVDKEFNITQQGVMMRVTNSLENKLFSLFTVIRDKTEESEIAKQDRNKLNKGLLDERNFSSILLKENKTLEEQLANNESTIASLTCERDGLRYQISQNEKQIGILNKQSTEYVESVMRYKKLLSDYQYEIDQWKRVFANDKRSLLINYRQRIETINAKISEFDNNTTNVGETLISLAERVDSMSETVDKITRTCDEINLRILDLTDKCSLSNYVKTLFSKCQDVVNIAENKGGANHSESNKKESSKLTAPRIVGDPLADMTQQIDVNRKLIEKLEKQTRKLEKVVALLRAHKK